MSATEIVENQMDNARVRLIEQAETIGEVRECIREMEFAFKSVPISTDGCLISQDNYRHIVALIERAGRMVR